MAFTNKPHFILLFMISFILILFVSALDLSNAPAEAPTSGGDGLLPLAGKHVVIYNKVKNRQILNVHCRSSEDDFGMVHIPWNGTWDFRFHVNFSKTTKFRCHFTWYRGGSHYFYIFKVSRDDSPFGHFPVCKECIWEVGKDDENPICRIVREKGYLPWCFKWEDGP
ncbi:Plant self-incompatibility S1 [Arabidopsis suecica]|uniref:S-protein homolog n=1 Tax=Arabidopsis suecica TaxID=45249 RepID=A0A8T1ZZT1_ARASU|nr:Plant self-incompatibility S1 [Arabidopsis suecica]